MSYAKPTCYDAFSAFNYLTIYSSMIVIVHQVSINFSSTWSMIFTSISVFTMLLSNQFSLIMLLRKDFPIFISFILAAQLFFSMIRFPLGNTMYFLRFRFKLFSLVPEPLRAFNFKESFLKFLTKLSFFACLQTTA